MCWHEEGSGREETRGGGGVGLLFERHVSGPHNTTSMKKEAARGRETTKERAKEGKKKSCEALTDDLTAETEFVFCLEMSDALPERERERGRDG